MTIVTVDLTCKHNINRFYHTCKECDKDDATELYEAGVRIRERQEQRMLDAISKAAWRCGGMADTSDSKSDTIK